MVIFLSFIVMICWGVGPIVAKIGLKDINPLTGLMLRSTMTMVMVSSWIGINGGISKFKSISLYAIIFITIDAIITTVIGDLAYYSAIKRGQVSIVTIITSASPLVTLLLSTLFLGEDITFTKLIGSILVIFGIILTVY